MSHPALLSGGRADITAQQEKLEKRIREYIAWRTELVKPVPKPQEPEPEAQSAQPEVPEAKPTELSDARPDETHSEEDAAERALFPEEDDHPKEAEPASAEVKTEPDAPSTAASVPPPDLASQLFLPDSPSRLAAALFPSDSPSRSRFSTSQPPQKRPNLGEIAQLVDDLVRNREEKVAIAVGAYNNVS